MFFEIGMTRSYIVYEEARATVEAATKEEAIGAAWNDLDSLPWQTTDEEPSQDAKVTCEAVTEDCADFRAIGGQLVECAT